MVMLGGEIDERMKPSDLAQVHLMGCDIQKILHRRQEVCKTTQFLLKCGSTHH